MIYSNRFLKVILPSAWVFLPSLLSIFELVSFSRRQFLRKMWPFLIAFLLFYCLYDFPLLIDSKSVAYRGGGLGGFKPPPKFRRYRWNPRSHEQEEPVSPFPFVVHCVLIWFNLLNKGFLIQTVLQWRIWFRSSNPPRHPESLAKSNRIANWAENV